MELIPASSEAREDRMSFAEPFLEKVLVPAFFEGDLTAERIAQLFQEYKQQHPQSGDDAKLNSVQSILLRKFPASFLGETNPDIDPYFHINTMLTLLLTE